MAASMSEESLLDADLDAPLLKTNLSYSSIPISQPQPTVPPKRSKKCKVICGVVTCIMLLAITAATVVLIQIFSEPDGEVNWQDDWSYKRKILIWNTKYTPWNEKENELNRYDNNLYEYKLRQDLHCKVSNCEFIMKSNRMYWEEYREYDAVIFDMDHVSESNLRNLERSFNRPSKPYFIFAANNPRSGQERNLRQERDFYNLTMTYKLDSDIVWQRWHFQYRWSEEIASPQNSARWVTADRRTPSTSLVTSLERNKSKLSAFLAPCRNNSRHSNLIRELQQYMDIEVYADCNYTVSASSNSYDTSRVDLCTDSFDRKYKFFLAFEEELCDDYVSENFYKALNCSIVPVVLGGADYRNFAPPHSYIDATSFDSLRELADNLYTLERNLQEYAKYFWWKKYYDLKVISPFCDICEKVVSLIDRNNELGPTYWHAVDSWWKDSNCTAKSKFEHA